MVFSYYLGVDISKSHLDLCLIDNQQNVTPFHCENTLVAILNLLEQIADSAQELLICCEFTGMYGFNLIQAAQKLTLPLWLENPTQIKLSSGLQRGKNDPIDAFRIASYARRFADRASLLPVQDEALEYLSYLESERALLVADRAKYKAQRKDQKEFMPQQMFREKAQRLATLIACLDEQIHAIEQQMELLISEHPLLARQNELLQSIPGVGPRLACYMLIASKGFVRFKDPRAMCCHAGVAPFAYHSGDNNFTRARVSHRADKRLKALLHMAALSVIRKPGEIQDYYLRKCEEGKPKMSVINAVRSKLIHRMFAVVKRNEIYMPSY